jgi:hypothetical protein
MDVKREARVDQGLGVVKSAWKPRIGSGNFGNNTGRRLR